MPQQEINTEKIHKMTISRNFIEDLKKTADVRDFVPGLSGTGQTKYRPCPFCGKAGRSKGLSVSRKYAKCWSCGSYFKDVFHAVQHFENVNFPTSVKIVAERYGLQIK